MSAKVFMCAKNRRWPRLECASMGMTFAVVQAHGNVGRLCTDSSKSKGSSPGLKRILSELGSLETVWFQPLQCLVLQNEMRITNLIHFPVWWHNLSRCHWSQCKACPKKVCEEHHGKESEQFSAEGQCDCTGTRPESPVHGEVTE